MVEVSPQFRKRLARISAKAEEHVRTAMEQSADEMVETMRRIAPKRTGELRESIRWAWAGTADDPSRMSVGKVKSGAHKGAEFAELRLVIFAGNRQTGEAFYARWVEFGTSHSRAKPYFFPAYRGLRPTAKRRIGRALRKGLKDG